MTTISDSPSAHARQETLSASFFTSKSYLRFDFEKSLADYVLFITHELNNELLRIEAMLMLGQPLHHSTPNNPLGPMRSLASRIKHCAQSATEGYTCIREAINLAELIAVQERRLAGTRHAARLHVVNATPAIVDGDAFLLTCALRNLVENAIHHTNGNVRISVHTAANDGSVQLWVEDDGDGFRALSKQAGQSVRGWGLGTTIVTAIARIHNAQLKVRLHPSHGVGLLFRSTASPVHAPDRNAHLNHRTPALS